MWQVLIVCGCVDLKSHPVYQVNQSMSLYTVNKDLKNVNLWNEGVFVIGESIQSGWYLWIIYDETFTLLVEKN